MNICYKRRNLINIIFKFKENKECKVRQSLQEIKINSNKLNLSRKFLKEDKSEFLILDNVDKMKNIQNINGIQNKFQFSFNKNLSKCLKNYKLFNIFLYFILFFIKFLIPLCKCNREKILFNLSEVTLKVKGKGNITILSDEFYPSHTPYQIYINDSLENIITNKYYFINSENCTVKIIWNNIIKNTDSMFKDCNEIIEIDLSNFYSSQISSMSCMFYNCASLKSLNLSNFDTSIVNKMTKMFYDCKSLISLDLSNFNTSQVSDMSLMFVRCSSLKKLNLSNFDTSKVANMKILFYYCSNLTSLDLTNFKTSNVKNMSYMFYYCSSLQSLNINNFNTSKVEDMSHMFCYCKN